MISKRSTRVGPPFSRASSSAISKRNGAATAELQTADRAVAEGSLQTRVDGLVYAYRTLGHTIARLDPLADKRPENILLSLRELGFSEKDLDMQVASKFFMDNKRMTLREMIAALGTIYADTIGSEFMHIQNTRIRNWVRHRLESRPPKQAASREVQIALLKSISNRSSSRLSSTPATSGRSDFRCKARSRSWSRSTPFCISAPARGIQEIRMGMAHRGRLNVLANFMQKSFKVIFTEFTENYVPNLVEGDGDVKYHLGYRTIRKLASGAEIEIRLAANPSYLEAVDPVVEGLRARGNAFAATPKIAGKFCRCSSMAMPPLPDKAWCMKR